VPDNVTVPFSAWTATCLFCNPESAASRDWMFDATCESLGGLLHATASARVTANIAVRRNRVIVTFIGELLNVVEGFIPV
jgi:hypothetical protein